MRVRRILLGLLIVLSLTFISLINNSSKVIAAEHEHTDDCYDGHRHVGDKYTYISHKHTSCIPYTSEIREYYSCNNCGKQFWFPRAWFFWNEATNSAQFSHAIYDEAYCLLCHSSNVTYINTKHSRSYSCGYNLDLDGDGLNDETSEAHLFKATLPKDQGLKATYTNGCYSYHIHKMLDGYGPGTVYYSKDYYYYDAWKTSVVTQFNNNPEYIKVFCYVPLHYSIRYYDRAYDQYYIDTTYTLEKIGTNFIFRFGSCRYTLGATTRYFTLPDTYRLPSGGEIFDMLQQQTGYGLSTPNEPYDRLTASGGMWLCDAKGLEWYTSCGQEQDETPECDRVVTSITATHPNQTVYQGSSIITTATATYLDGHTGIVNCTSNFNPNKIGSQTVTLTYSGLVENAKTTGTRTCTVSVAVTANLSHITATAAQTIIYNGSTPLYNVTAHYFDGSTKSLSSSQYSISGWSSGVGRKTVTFSYTENGKTVSTSIIITVKPNAVSLHVVPSATRIYQGESIVFSVKVYYEDSTSRTLTTGEYGQSSFDSNRAGEQTVHFSYVENARTVTTHVNITVLARLLSLTVTANKLEIYRGDEAPQFTLTAFYESGLSKIISRGKYAAFNNNRIGNQTLPFSYTENGITKTASIIIKVKPNLRSISTEIKEDIIFIGQHPDLTVKAFYEDGSNRLLSDDEYTMNGFDNMALGEQGVTISYTENSITASNNLTILVLEPGFDAYASAPIITPTSNSVGSKVLFSARTYNAEVVDILYSVDNSGFFSSTKSELRLKEGAHIIKAKTVWKKLLESDTQTTGYSSYKYDLSVPGYVINRPSIYYDKLTGMVTISDNGATNTIIDRIEYSLGKLINGDYQYTDHVYMNPFTLPSLGNYKIKARAIDIDSNKSDEAELHISIQVEVDSPVIKYNKATKSFSLQNFSCRNADYDKSFYNINNGEWKTYIQGDNVALADGEYTIKAYNTAVKDGVYFNSSETETIITVTSSVPTTAPDPGEGFTGEGDSILNNGAIISLVALMVILFAWMIKQKLK